MNPHMKFECLFLSVYSEDLLLQEDSTCESSFANAFGRGMHLGSAGASISSGSHNSSTSRSSSNPNTQR